MTTVVLVTHLMIALALVGVVLLQRSEGGALGMGGAAGGFVTGRGAANLLTRTTAVLAFMFFATSITLTIMSRNETGTKSILDSVPGTEAPASQTSAPAPLAPPPAPTEPDVPVAQ